MSYPTLEEIEPYLLTRIGASAWEGLEQKGWAWEQNPTPIRSRTPDERREYDRTRRRAWAGRRKIAGRKVG